VKESGVPRSTHQTFVVTAIFMTQRTVCAKSEQDALDMAHDTLVEDGATKQNLVNWHAHAVEEQS
jgi:hypothetical protein